MFKQISLRSFNFAFLFSSFSKGLLSPTQETAVKNCIDNLNSLLMVATKKRPDGPPSVLSGTDNENKEKEKLKSFLAETLAKQLVQRGMKDITEYELHKVVYAIATKTCLGKVFSILEFQALKIG